MNARKLLDWLFKRNNISEVEEIEELLRIERPISNRREGAIQEHSDTWLYVSNWAEAELDKARCRNDSHKRDFAQTSALRGRIEILKELLELPHPKERRNRSSEQQED